MRFLGIDLDLLTPAERPDLANALLRAAWSAALEDTRVLLSHGGAGDGTWRQPGADVRRSRWAFASRYARPGSRPRASRSRSRRR